MTWLTDFAYASRLSRLSGFADPPGLPRLPRNRGGRVMLGLNHADSRLTGKATRLLRRSARTARHSDGTGRMHITRRRRRAYDGLPGSWHRSALMRETLCERIAIRIRSRRGARCNDLTLTDGLRRAIVRGPQRAAEALTNRRNRRCAGAE